MSNNIGHLNEEIIKGQIKELVHGILNISSELRREVHQIRCTF